MTAEGSTTHEDRGPELIVYSFAMMGLTVLALALRFTSRAITTPANKCTSRFWWDDWTALAAGPFILTVLGLNFPADKLGLGKHVAELNFANFSPIIKIVFAMYYCYVTGITLIRASALLYFSRIFEARASPKWFTNALYIMHGINVAWIAGTFVVLAFICTPIEKFWTPLMPGHCMTTAQLWIPMAVLIMIFDLMILLLPMPIIYSLTLSRWQKMGLFCIFLLAYATVVVSIGCVVSVVQVGDRLNTDGTYSAIPAYLWFYAEGPIAMICTCIPAMISLGRHIWAYCVRRIPFLSMSSGSAHPTDNIQNSENGIHKATMDAYSTQEWDQATLHDTAQYLEDFRR